MTQERSPLRMLADLLATCARHATQIVAGLATVAMVVRMLGAESLGAWAVLGTTSFLIALSDLGLSVAVQRVAARSDPAATRQVIRLALLVVAVLCPCLAVGAYAFFLQLPSASEALRADIARAAVPTLAAGLAGALAGPLRSFLLMRGAFTPLAWSRAAAAAVQIGCTAAVLVATHSLLGPALGLLAGATLELLLLARASKRLDPQLLLRPGWPADRAQARDAFHQGFATLVMNIAVAAAVRADVLILTTYATLGSVGAYQVAARAVDQIHMFAKQAGTWLLHRLGNPEHRVDALRMGTAIMGGLVASGVVALAFNGTALLEAWVGALAHDPVTAIVLGLLGTAAIIAASEEMATAALTVSGASTWDAVAPVILGHLLNVTVSLIGVRYVGAWAVAGGTLLGNTLIALLIWGKVRKLVRWHPREMLWVLAPVAAATLVSLAAGWGLAPLAARGPLLSALSCSFVTALGTAAAVFLWWRRHLRLAAPPEDAPACAPSP